MERGQLNSKIHTSADKGQRADVTARNTLCVSSVQEERRRFALSILVHQQSPKTMLAGLFLRIGRRLQSARVKPDVGRAVVFMTVKSYVDQDDDEDDGWMEKRRTCETNAKDKWNLRWRKTSRSVASSRHHYGIVCFLDSYNR